MKVTVKRLNNAVHMEATNKDGATLQMDGSEDIGGINGGMRPTEMLLAAAAGCSSIDIIGILKKQKQNLVDLTVEVTGEKEKVETWSEFKAIHMHYIFSGDIDKNKAERAIDLSINKYCSVSKMLEKSAKITSSYVISNPET